MEYIKKEIKLKTILVSGYTGTTKFYKIVPDTGTTYNFKILLTQNARDLGFFDTIDNTIEQNEFPIISNYPVTGNCTSRLNEIRKNSINPIFYKNYFYSIDTTADGLDIYDSYFYTGDTLNNPITLLSFNTGITGITNYNFKYFIDGIEYKEFSGLTNSVQFKFISLGDSSPDILHNKIYKDENKQNIINNPKIDSDVFIERQEISVFEKNYNLEFVKSIFDIETFAGGNYYNIINNS